MVTALVLVGVIAVAALVLASAAFVRRPSPSLIGKTVVVYTRKPDDRTLRGVLVGEYSDRWTLREAVALLPGGNEQQLGGIEHVPTRNIAFAQEIES